MFERFRPTIKTFEQKSEKENDFYAFRYFILNHIEIFFPEIPLQKIIKGFL